MRRLLKAPMLLAACLAGACAVAPGPAADSPGEEAIALMMDPAVEQRAVALAGASKAAAGQFALAAVHEIKNVGNFGKLVHHEWTARHVRTPNGLWEVVIGGGRFVSAPEPRANQTLSLCGLIPLLRSARFSTELGGTIDTRLRVKSLRTDSTRLCAPGPDAAFDYQVESELQTKSTGMFRQTTTRTLSSDVRCRAAGESRPASELATGLNGQYLPVSCESVSNGSDKVNLRFAFVDQLGVYLVLTESARHAETTTHYKELAIRQ